MDHKKKNKRHMRQVNFSNLEYEPLKINKNDSEKDIRFLTLDTYRESLFKNKLPKIKPYKRHDLTNNSSNMISFSTSLINKTVTRENDSATNLSTLGTSMIQKNEQSKLVNITDAFDEANSLIKCYKWYKEKERKVTENSNYKNQSSQKITEDKYAFDESLIFEKYKIHEDEKEMEKFRSLSNRRDHDKSWFLNSFITHNKAIHVDELKEYYPKIEVPPEREIFHNPDHALRTIQINRQIYENVEKIYTQKHDQLLKLKQDKINHYKSTLKKMPEVKMLKTEVFKIKEILKLTKEESKNGANNIDNLAANLAPNNLGKSGVLNHGAFQNSTKIRNIT